MSARVRVVSFRVLFSCLLILAAAGALAQTSINDVHITSREIPSSIALVASNYGSGSLIHARSDLVLVPVSITNSQNEPLIGLDQQNFQLFENKKPQEIKNFSSEDTPISVGIVLDVSGSMGSKLERAHEAVAQFCDDANPQDEFFLITFSDRPVLITDFTTRPEKLQNDLLAVRSKGRTALLDAVYMAVVKMRHARYARKAILILSDGGDNHSRYNEREVKAIVKESDVMLYSVGTFDHWVPTQEELLGPELLQSLTGMTGGHSFTINTANDMPGVTRAISAQLRHQYVLAYQPQSAPKDGKWHKISVKLLLPKRLRTDFFRVASRPGYYASDR